MAVIIDIILRKSSRQKHFWAKLYRYNSMEDDLKTIIREHRRLSGLSQPGLARLAGVGKTVIFDIEHGKETVQFNTLKKVLAALNIKFVLQSPVLLRNKKHRAGKTPP
jgi:ribosome-binding protein aMBF1 (putative translation factor)